MNSKSKESKEALARFNEHVSKLRGDDLLDLKIAFDRLPPAEESERNLRRAQGYTLGAALLQEFGVGKWQGPWPPDWTGRLRTRRPFVASYRHPPAGVAPSKLLAFFNSEASRSHLQG
jgi:hypothetical protein